MKIDETVDSSLSRQYHIINHSSDTTPIPKMAFLTILYLYLLYLIGSPISTFCFESYLTASAYIERYEINFIAASTTFAKAALPYFFLLLFGLVAIDHQYKKFKEWHELRNDLYDQIRKKSEQNSDIHQRYDRLKRNISEVVSPCGQIIVNADDTVSLQHLYCSEYCRLEFSNQTLRKENVRLRNKYLQSRIAAEFLVPNNEHTKLLEAYEIQARDSHIELLRVELSCRRDEIKDLKNDLVSITKSNIQSQSKVAALEKSLADKVKSLSDATKAFEDIQASSAYETILRLKQDLSQRQLEIAEFKEQKRICDGTIGQLTRDRAQFQSCADSLRAECEQNSKTISELSSLLEKSKSSVDARQRDLESKISEIGKLKSEVSDATAAQKEKDSLIDDLRRQLGEKEEQLVQFQIEIEALWTASSISASTAEDLKRESARGAELEDKLQKSQREVETLRSRKPVISDIDIIQSPQYQALLANFQNIQNEKNSLLAAEEECRGLQFACDTAARIVAQKEEEVAQKSNELAETKMQFEKMAQAYFEQKTVEVADAPLMDIDAMLRHKDATIEMQKMGLEAKSRINETLEAQLQANAGAAAFGALQMDLEEKEKAISDSKEKMSKASSTIADLIRELNNKVVEKDHIEKLLAEEREDTKKLADDGNTLRQIKQFLDVNGIGPSSVAPLERIVNKMNELRRSSATGIKHLLDDEQIMMTIPGSKPGRAFPNLKARVAAVVKMAKEASAAAAAASNIDTVNAQDSAMNVSEEPTRSTSPVATSTNEDEKNATTLNQIKHMLNSCRILTPGFSLEKRVDHLLGCALDSTKTFDLLHTNGLLAPTVKHTIHDQVEFLIADRAQHIRNVAALHANNAAVMNELCKRWGPPVNEQDTILARVKKMVSMPAYRKGELRE